MATGILDIGENINKPIKRIRNEWFLVYNLIPQYTENANVSHNNPMRNIRFSGRPASSSENRIAVMNRDNKIGNMAIVNAWCNMVF